MKNGWYPKQKLGNKNVPDGVNIIGSLVMMSGEIVETYYSIGYSFYKVKDWVNSKPERTTSEEIVKIEKQYKRR